MADVGWLVQIYEMSDAEAQGLVGGVLCGIDGLTVELAVRDEDQFLIVNCDNAIQAVAVQRFVKAIDPRALLVHTSTGSRQLAESSVA